jgi:hypothetical protein
MVVVMARKATPLDSQATGGAHCRSTTEPLFKGGGGGRKGGKVNIPSNHNLMLLLAFSSFLPSTILPSFHSFL